MPTMLDAACRCINRCTQLRDQGKVEAVLRNEFASWLRSIFPEPDDACWVNHYSEGTEAGVRVGQQDGTMSQRFVDNLVRSTVIEFEADLRDESRYEEGQRQVQEYVAGALRGGTPVSQVRGILSDTVEWHVYEARVAEGVKPEECTPGDVVLTEAETLQLPAPDEDTARRFVDFLRKHLARQQSRPLRAALIASDLGLESAAYRRHIGALSELVDNGRADDSAVRLATNLWSQFVDYLEGLGGEFRTVAYVDEAYVAILARLLCANVLEQRAQLSETDELGRVLTGEYFYERFQLLNMVEQDYFGWLWRPPCLGRVLPIASEIQRDLYAYDFSQVSEEDLFGRLMAQLARRTQRRLLGQEWTPQWVAEHLARKCVSLLPAGDRPRIIDPCCGSGAVLAEALKAVRAARPDVRFPDLSVAVTGFDIDPLAVLLAKITWVVAMAQELRLSSETVKVPVYHADSLFAATPITRRLPLPGEAEELRIELDQHPVVLPASLVSAELQPLFDGIVDWAYDEARAAQKQGTADHVTQDRVAELVQGLTAQYELQVEPELAERVVQGALALAKRMAELAIAGRNGIWAFILRNTYRPGLLAGQFNGLVSNPPWLTMSQFADNPYKEQLSARARVYGVRPGGAAHLHLELATTHLLHAVDRYLMPEAAVACLIPGTVFNGQHHAKFRDATYLNADRPVPFDLREVWGIAPGTFKVRAAAVIGVKRQTVEAARRTDAVGVIATPSGLKNTTLEMRLLGRRTAWVLGGARSSVGAGTDEVPPQGADLMPRPAVCVEIVSRRGPEWRVRTPRRTDTSYFAVKDAKKLKGRAFAGSVAPAFIHHMAQSLNLLPFLLDGNLVHIAIPARRGDEGPWETMDAAAIRTAGFIQTARRFQRIDRAMAEDHVVKPLYLKINERNKLSAQSFPRNHYLVLNGAGGEVVCAACLLVADHPDMVVDQTLYWALVSTEQEAWFRVGLLNTDALTEAIREFIPEGEFGPRHLHTLPNRVIPAFDRGASDHVEIARLAQELSGIAQSLAEADESIANPCKAIASRRRRLRDRLKEHREFADLDDLAAAILSRLT